MKAFFATIVCVLAAVACGGTAPTTEAEPATHMSIPLAPGSTYVEHDGDIEIFGAGEANDPSAHPLESLSVEDLGGAVLPAMKPNGNGGPRGASGWCCSGCQGNPDGSMTCRECHTC